MSRQVYVDETKRAGYVLATVTVADPGATRKLLRELVLPGQRRIHMKHEQAPRRHAIVSALVAAGGIEVTVYDAARRHPRERDARAACLHALVEDLAATGTDTALTIEQDDTLISFDRQVLYRATHATGCSDRVRYQHCRAHAEPLLALPDITAWCWVRSGDWRRRITPMLAGVRTV